MNISRNTGAAARGATSVFALALALVSPQRADAQPSPGSEDVFYYLRCNATGWDAAETTRLQPTADPNVFELTYRVSEPWMLSVGDDCSILETNAENGWGTQARILGSDHPITLGIDVRTRLVPRNDADAANFKVRYANAGVHHARYYRAERTLAIREDGPLTEGGELWSMPGTLVADAQGRLYRTRYQTDPSQPGPAFGRVSREDGTDVWSIPDASFYVDPACAYREQLIVRAPNEGILALDPESGRTLWSTNFDGALGTFTPVVVSCSRSGDAVAVVFAGDAPTAAVLSRTTGATLWTAPADPFAAVVALTSNTLLTRAYVGAGNRVRAFDLTTGAELWTSSSEAWSSVFASPAGEVYVSVANELQQIDPRTGAIRFRVPSTNAFPWLTFEAGGTFLRDVDRIVKIDPATGASLWSLDLRSPFDPYPSSTVLKSGRVVVTRRPEATNTTELTLLDGESGQVLWVERIASTTLWPEEDPNGRLYVRGERTLSRLDPRNGRTLWRYEHPAEGDQPYYSGGLGFVADSDRARVYVTYRAPGYRYPPMSLIGLDAGTGERRFQFDDSGAIEVIGADDQRIFIQSGYFVTMVRALLK